LTLALSLRWIREECQCGWAPQQQQQQEQEEEEEEEEEEYSKNSSSSSSSSMRVHDDTKYNINRGLIRLQWALDFLGYF
jgi:hypothetical protein